METIYRDTENRIFSKTVQAVFLLGIWAVSTHAETVPAASKAYVYWTNNDNGSIGRAATTGTGADETFIASITGGAVGGAGLTLDNSYIYWTSANGGSATTIARASLDGTDVNNEFITGALNPCGIAVNSSYIYWAGDVGTSIGRANIDGTGANQEFIETGNGVCGVAVTKSYIYWANYETGDIGRAKLDGSDVNDHFISGSSSGVAVEGDYIYFTAGDGTSTCTKSSASARPGAISSAWKTVCPMPSLKK